MRHYFFERCALGPKSKDFLPTKQFLSKKGSVGGYEIIQWYPASQMSINDYFVNVAKEIGNSSNEYKYAVSEHPSI